MQKYECLLIIMYADFGITLLEKKTRSLLREMESTEGRGGDEGE